MLTTDRHRFSFRVLMKNILIIILILVPLVGYLGYSLFIEATAPIDKAPYVHWNGLDPHSQVYISWETSSTEGSYVEYGYSPDELNFQKYDATPKNMHHVIINLPESNRKYYYRVGSSSNNIISKIQSFSSAPDVKIPFNITLISDTQQMWGTGHYNTIADAINYMGDSSFIAYAGDLGQEPDSQVTWNYFMQQTAKISDTMPIVHTPGNHDGDGGADTLYAKYFNVSFYNSSSLPGVEPNKLYHSFNWSNIQFVCAEIGDGGDKDPSVPYNFEHYAWLNHTLAMGQSKDYRILMFHRQIYSSIDNDRTLLDNMMPIIIDYNVSLVFYGHMHIYERYLVQNHTLVCLGGGGGLQNIISKDQGELTRVDAMGATFTKVFFNGDDYDVLLRTYSPTYDIIDDVVLRKEGSKLVIQEERI